MADAAEAGDFERQFGGRDVDAHAADDDRYQFPFAESQTEIIHASHFVPYDVCWRSWWRLRGQRPEKFLVTPVTREASRRPVCGVRGALPRVQAMRGRGSRTTAYCTLSAVAPDQSRPAGTRSGADAQRAMACMAPIRPARSSSSIWSNMGKSRSSSFRLWCCTSWWSVSDRPR